MIFTITKREILEWVPPSVFAVGATPTVALLLSRKMQTFGVPHVCPFFRGEEAFWDQFSFYSIHPAGDFGEDIEIRVVWK